MVVVYNIDGTLPTNNDGVEHIISASKFEAPLGFCRNDISILSPDALPFALTTESLTKYLGYMWNRIFYTLRSTNSSGAHALWTTHEVL